MQFRNKLAIIVPTKDREEDLRKLLSSFLRQTDKSARIIIVDGGDKTVKHVVEEFSDLNIQYVRIYPPGLTKQRNAGIKALSDDLTLVGYLDDDIVLEDDAVEKMLAFWESAPVRTGGASFNIVNNIPTTYNWFTRFFCFNNGKQGTILKSGFIVVLYPVLKNTAVEWLCGGATVWKREIIDRFKYDEWFIGCSYIEDVDYSCSVNQEYDLVVVADAKLSHFVSPLDERKNFPLIRSNVINRHYFVRKHKQYSLPLFYWAVTGQVIGNLFSGLLRNDRPRLLRAFGGISALIGIFSGKAGRNRGFSK